MVELERASFSCPSRISIAPRCACTRTPMLVVPASLGDREDVVQHPGGAGVNPELMVAKAWLSRILAPR